MLRAVTRPVRHGALFLAFALFRAAVAATPRRVALAAAGVLGDAAYALGGATRDAARVRIQQTLGVSEAKARGICREMYRHFGYDLVDLMIFGGWRRRRLARHIREVTSFEHVAAAMAAGRGVVGLTAHLCLWELFGGYVASRLGGIAVLAHPAYDANFDRLLVGYRKRLAVRTLYRQEPAAVPLGLLRDGGFLGVLADQDIPDMPSVIVDFMGLPARTPVGPALLARRAGAPLIPMYIYRRPDLDYGVVIEPPMEPSRSRSVKDALREDTAAWSARVGAWVRQYPAQWVWVHDRWRGGAAAEGPAPETGG